MEEGIAWGIDRGEFRVYHLIPRVIGGAISGALTGLFAFAGASTGAITGAIAGKASDSGVIRGAALGAIAGAVLSVEVLEVSRAYLSSELSAVSGSRNSSSMADFIEELLRSRFVDELFPPEISAAYHWQVAVSNLRQDDVYDVNGEITSRRLSRDSLKNLPSHEIKSTQSNCCPICLQDMVVGEIARSLPRCQHVFHLVCVDKWLSRHGSCPVCRRDV